MLMPSQQFKIFIYSKSVDMRMGFDRLAAICRSEIGLNPSSGAVFMFFGQRRDRLKIYYYDGTGACVFYKRLDRGKFLFPSAVSDSSHISIKTSELAGLLEGALPTE